MIDQQLFLLIPVFSSILSNIFTHIFAWSYFKHYSECYSFSNWAPTISIIVPLRGIDEYAMENLQSIYQQNYPNDYEIIFSVEEQNDPVIPLIQSLMEKYGAVESRLIISHNLNIKAFGKVKNLIAGYMLSQNEVIILIDSDVHVLPTFLMNTVRVIENPKVGLAFAAPICEGAKNWIAALQNIAVNIAAIIFASGAYLNKIYASAGGVMAMRREVIEKIGGFEQIADRFIGIDLSIGQAIREAGFNVHLLKQPARSYNEYNNFKQFWLQMHRWLVTTNLYYPAIPFLVILGGFPLWWSILFLYIGILRDSYVLTGILLIILVIAVQLISTAIINIKLVKDTKLWRFLWVVVLGELIGLPIFIHSVLSNKVFWRGRWMRVKRNLTANVLEE